MASRHVIVTALLLLAVASSSRAAVNLSLSFGIRHENDEGDRLPAVGLAADVGGRSWPLRPEIGAHMGFNPLYPGNETELNLGLVHYWDLSPCRLHFGGGVASIASKFGYNEGSTKGGYLHGGIAWSRGEKMTLGIDLRVLKVGDLKINGTSYPVGYEQLAFFMRWRYWRDR